MQLLYGNDGINYHTIAKSKDLTGAQEKELLAGYLGYDFVGDSSAYSSAAKEPVSLSYVTTNLVHTLPDDMVLLVKNARMTNYQTPSYYAHVHLLPLSEELYGERFFDFLTYAFIRDEELAAYQDADIDTFVQGRERGASPVRRDALTKEQLLVIVAAVLDVADSMSRQVHLVLDVEGDGYNRRAAEVIASVYECLPGTLRRKVGFSTYEGAASETSSRIGLVLHTRDAAGKLGRDAIDLAHLDAREILRRIPAATAALAKAFVGKEKEERDQLLLSYRLAFGIEPVSVADHIDFYKHIHLWQTGGLEAMRDELAKYAAAEMQKKETSPTFRVFHAVMEKRFAAEQFDVRYQQLLWEMLKTQSSFDFDSRLRAYLMLGEAVECLTFDEKMFLRWEREILFAGIKSRYEDMELYGQLKKQYKKLRSAPTGRSRFQGICAAMEQCLREELGRTEAEIRRRISEEGETLTAYFAQGRGKTILSDLAARYEQIRYKENRELFCRALYQKYEAQLDGIRDFERYEAYEGYRKLIGTYREYLVPEEYEALSGMVEQRGEVVRRMEEYKRISWRNRGDVLSSWQNIANMHAVSEGHKVQVPDYVLKLGLDEYRLPEKDVELLAKGLLCPDRQNREPFVGLLAEQEGLMQALMEQGLFGAEHFELLMSSSDRRGKKEVLAYYLNGEHLLSEDEIGKAVRGLDLTLLTELEEEAGQNNILRACLRKKAGRDTGRGTEQSRAGKEFDADADTEAGLEFLEDRKTEPADPETRVRDRNHGWQNAMLPQVLLLGTLIPAFIFAAGALLKVFVISTALIPGMFTAVGVLVLAVSVAQQCLVYKRMRVGCFAGIISGIAMIPAAWVAWLLF